jgi:hypothetical protein
MPSLRSQSNKSRLQKPQMNDDAGGPSGSSSPIGTPGGLGSALGRLARPQGRSMNRSMSAGQVGDALDFTL